MIESLIIPLIFLIGSSLVTGITSAIQRIGKTQAETAAKHQRGLGKLLFKKSKRDLLSYALTITKNILLICYTLTAFAFALSLFSKETNLQIFLLSGLVILGISLLSDYLFRSVSLFRPLMYFKATCQFVSFFLILFWGF